MTRPRTEVLNRSIRFKPSPAHWDEIISRGRTQALSDAEKRQVVRAADIYLQMAGDFRGGVPDKEVQSAAQSLAKSLDGLIDLLGAKIDDNSQRHLHAALAHQVDYILRYGNKRERKRGLRHMLGELRRLNAVLSGVARGRLSLMAPNREDILDHFIIRLAVIFEARTGRTATARKDDVARVGEEEPRGSPFAAFAFAVFQALPAFNEKPHSLSAMSAAIQSALRKEKSAAIEE